jgi:hypothetical protein
LTDESAVFDAPEDGVAIPSGEGLAIEDGFESGLLLGRDLRSAGLLGRQGARDEGKRESGAN